MDKSIKFANIVLGIITFSFFCILLYAVFKHNAHPPGYMNKYYILSLAGLLGFTYILKKCDNELKVRISLLMISIAGCIYAVEIVLSYNKPSNFEQDRAKLAQTAGISYDTRHRAQVWLDLRNNGIDAYPLYNPFVNMNLKNKEILPLGYISGKTILSCNESGEHIIFKSDEHGFNNPEGLYNEKNIDYVLIGDSLTQGACVKREDTIAGRLMKSGEKVLNLGMLNSGPPNELAILKEYAKPIKPRIVFWLFYEGNDHEGLEFEKKSSFIMKYLDKDFSQHLINKQKLIDEILIEQIEKEYANVKENIESLIEKNNKMREASFQVSLSTITLPRLRGRLAMINKGCEITSDPLFREFMQEAKASVNGWSGQLVFVYLPSYDRYPEKINKCRKRFLDTGREQVLRIIENLEIPIIDIEKVFSSHPDPLSLFPFRIFGHYNEKGYSIVADEIDRYISEYSTDIRRR